MKKLIFLSLAVVALFVMNSCSTKFNVAAPYKNITVIYGFLDQADTAHYIRVQKAFLDNNKSAITMAQTPDSSFYATLRVKIERINLYTTGGVHDTILNVKRVDLNLEGYPKETGAFFNAPNYAYKFTDNLDPRYSYRIVVYNPATGETDSAEAPVIVDTDSTVFNVPYLDDFNLNHAGLAFVHTPVNTNNTIDIGCLYSAPTTYGTYNFYGQTSPAGVCQMVVRFKWVDSVAGSTTRTSHSGDYNLGFTTVKGGAFNFTINNVDMYTAVRSTLGPAQANVYRLMDRCTLFAYLATPDYYTYEQIQANQGTGLTGNEIEPIYTNIKGANVLGLFASKGTRFRSIPIEDETLDSLVVSSRLTDIKIRGKAY